MYKSVKLYFFACLLLCVATILNAQKGNEIGGFVGTAWYYGDLNTTLRVIKPGFAGGVLAKRNLNERLSLRGGFNYSRINGDDALSSNIFQRGRNLSFRNDIIDFTGGIEFNFLEHIHGSKYNWYTPYVFVGFSVLGHSPSAVLEGVRYKLRPLGTEGQDVGSEYNTLTGGIIIAPGFKWDISKDVSLNVELSYRRVFTDYLDDVSGLYPDFGDLRDLRGDEAASLSNRSIIDGIGIEGRQRGNSSTRDSYITLGIGICKYFGQIECPKISEW